MTGPIYKGDIIKSQHVIMDAADLTPIVGSGVGAVTLYVLWYLSRRGLHSHCLRTQKGLEVDLDVGTPPGESSSAAKVAHLLPPAEPESYQAAAREIDGKASTG